MDIPKSLQGKLMSAALKAKAYQNKQPIHATFEFTPRCGFNCRMCYVHLPEHKIYGELTGKQWLDIARQTVEMGVLSLCITGGDPILHPDFEEIWTGLCQMGFQITLQTTAAFFKEKHLRLFEEYPPSLVKITLYGSNDTVYKDVCRKENGFTKTDKGIQALKTLGIPIQLVTTFIKQNYEDRNGIVDYARKNNFPWYYSAACYPSLRGADSQARECALSVWDLGCAENTSQIWKEKGAKANEQKPCEMCSGYRTEYIITWNGDMRFCTLLNKPNISVINKDLEVCWNELLLYWESLRWPKKCYTCSYKEKCIRCLAHLACYSGGLNKLDENYCEGIKKMIDLRSEEDQR